MADLRREIYALPAERQLVASERTEVFVAKAQEIPAVVWELGRLREITFRKVGEGTGAARDLDDFDQHYEHLFAWNEETGELIGAYRIAKSDEVIARNSVRADSYTSTLFRLQSKFYDEICPALEGWAVRSCGPNIKKDICLCCCCGKGWGITWRATRAIGFCSAR